jgi:hypothetical protein
MNAQETKPRVHFGDIDIRTYAMTIGDNPSVSIGPPVALSWSYKEEEETQDLEEYEKLRKGRRRKPRYLVLNYYQRIEIIEGAGVEAKEIKTVERQVFWDRSSRAFSRYLCYPKVFVGSIRASCARIRNKRLLRKLKRESTPENAD